MPTTSTAEIINEGARAIVATLDESNPPEPVMAIETKPRIGDVYAVIDAAPKEWLPSILARVARRAAKENIWPDTDALLGAIKTFVAKKP